MIGFIKGIFSGSKKNQSEPEPQVETAPVAPTKPGAYFLDADSARTWGDIDYMRSSRSIRRTFPGQGGEIEVKAQVSAFDQQLATEATSEGSGNTPIAAATMPVTQTSEELMERRQLDTSMDLFRSMARDIKKK